MKKNNFFNRLDKFKKFKWYFLCLAIFITSILIYTKVFAITSPSGLDVTIGGTPTNNASYQFTWLASEGILTDYRIQVCSTNNFVGDYCMGDLIYDTGDFSAGGSQPDTINHWHNDADGSGDDRDDNGLPLDWGSTYYWRARVKVDAPGPPPAIWSQWSSASNFTMDNPYDFSENFQTDDYQDSQSTTGLWDMSGSKQGLGKTFYLNKFEKQAEDLKDNLNQVIGEDLDDINPVFVNIDFDSDNDLFFMSNFSQGRFLAYYRNIGSATLPIWENHNCIVVGANRVGNCLASTSGIIRGADFKFVDYDGDSDFDLIVTGDSNNPNNNLTVYRNGGLDANGNVLWTLANNDCGESSINLLYQKYFSFADIDGDNDEDLFVVDGITSSQQLIYFYQNENSGGFCSGSNWQLITDQYNEITTNVWDVELADIDGDNDFDLFYTPKYASDNVIYYQNVGDINNAKWQLMTDDFSLVEQNSFMYHSSITITSIDGDSDMDMFIGRQKTPAVNDGGIIYYQNNGGFEEEYLLRDSDYSGLNWSIIRETAPTFVDIDADGDEDLFISNRQYGGFMYFENIGDATLPVFSFASQNYLGLNISGASLDFTDIDADGDEDLFYITIQGNITFYRNNGTAQSPDFFYVTGDYGNINISSCYKCVLHFSDIDYDNDQDIFVGKYNGWISYIENTGTPEAASWGSEIIHFQNIYVSFNAAPFFYDLDNDNDLDLFVGNYYGEIYYYLNNQGSFINQGTVAEGVGALATPIVTDIDNDFLADMLSGGRDGDIWHFIYQNPNWITETERYLDYSADESAPVFTDIDNDSDLDMFIGDIDGVITYFENIGNENAPLWSWQTGDYFNIDVGTFSKPAFVDYDSDSDLDLIVGSVGGTLYYYQNNGTIDNPQFVLTPGTGLDSVDVGMFAAPTIWKEPNIQYLFVGSGNLIGSENGRIRLYYINNSGGVANAGEIKDSLGVEIDVGANSAPFITYDAALNAYYLYVGNDIGEIRRYKHLGAFSSTNWIEDTSANLNNINMVSNSTPSLADIDNDSSDLDLDLFIGSSYGSVQYYQNQVNFSGNIQSTNINDSIYEIADVILYPSYSLPSDTLISYYVSNNGGGDWSGVSPGALHTFSTVGDDLRWRAFLKSTSGTNPSPLLGSMGVGFSLSLPDLAEPYNLTAQTAGPDQINLAWQYDEPENIEGYYVYRGGQEIATVPSGGVNGDYYIEFSDTGLNNETAYSYYVVAYSGLAESDPSNVAQATTSNWPDLPSNLQVNLAENFSRPEFIWTYTDTNNNDMSAYRVIVYVQEDSTADYNLFSREMWDSGKISKVASSGDDNVSAFYNDSDGVADDNNSFAHPLDWNGFLGENDYYVRVQVWDEYGLDSELSSAVLFKPEISGNPFIESFDDNENENIINTTADWNSIYGEARLNSFATANTYQELIGESNSIKAAAYYNTEVIPGEYYIIYFKKTTGNYGLYYSSFEEDGTLIISNTLEGDLGTDDATDLSANIICDPLNNLCGVVHTGQRSNLDAYFFEINSNTGDKTIQPLQLDGSGYSDEKAPVISFGSYLSSNKYLVSWYEEEYPDREAYYALIKRSNPSVTPAFIDDCQCNLFPSVVFNSNNQFGLTWSRLVDAPNHNSEIFFNIIDWNGEKTITQGTPQGKQLTYGSYYSNYPFISWESSLGPSGEYFIIWKDARNYAYIEPGTEFPSVTDVYFLKLSVNGGRLTGDIRLTDFPSRRKYFMSESAVAIDCNGKFGLSWLDDRGIGNTDNISLYNKTFNNYFLQFDISTDIGATVANKIITDSPFSTTTLPFPADFGVIEGVDTQRGLILSGTPVCSDYYSQIFDQGGYIYLQKTPNQNDNSTIYNITENIIQSDEVATYGSGIGAVTLYASDAQPYNLAPGETSVDYFIANIDNPQLEGDWTQITPGVSSYFTNTILRWKAVLNSTQENISPTIGSIALAVNNTPPNQPYNLQVDGWGLPGQTTATTTKDFTPELSWIYEDPLSFNLGAYRIQVCAQFFDNNSNNRCPDNELIWDSGKVSKTASSGDRIQISYNDYDGNGDNKDSQGHPLDWNYDYYWQAKVWNVNDLGSALWSDALLVNEPSAIFTYGSEDIDNLLVTDDMQVLPQGSFVYSAINAPEYYTGIHGEVRLVANFSNGTVIDSNGNVGQYTSIALDSKNLPHICYYDQNNDKLKYVSYNGSSWGTPEDINSSGQGGYACSLVIDNNDVPHVSYYGAVSGTKADLIYAVKENLIWVLETVEDDSVENDFIFARTSISVNSQNHPAISYFYKPFWPGRIRVARYNGTAWEIDQFNNPDDNKSGSENGLKYDQNDNLHLTYIEGVESDNRKLKYRFFNGSWSSAEEIDSTGSSYNVANISINIDSNSEPGVSYSIPLAGSNDLKYAKKSSGSWNVELIDNYSIIQAYTSLDFDSLNQPHIVFNGPSWDLYYLKYSNNTSLWEGTENPLESTGNIGRNCSLVIDNSDIPHISYAKFIDGQNVDDLMYIRPLYSTGLLGTIRPPDINPTSDSIYGIKFYASYSTPNQTGDITFYVSTDDSQWVDIEEEGGFGCMESAGGCVINFADIGSEHLYLIGDELYWKAEIQTSSQNYTPHIGSITFEKYNIPPTIVTCEFNPPAIDPNQPVTITLGVADESEETLNFSWCFDNDPPGGLGECPDPDPGVGPWTSWTGAGSYGNPAHYIGYTFAGIYMPEVQAKETEYPEQVSDVFACDNFFVGNVQISWLEAKYGNIYSQGDIHSYGVPCELCGDRNATYKLEAGGKILGFTTYCQFLCESYSNLTSEECREECIKDYSSEVYNFPKASLNFRNVLGDLTADSVMRELLTNADQYDEGNPPLGFEGYFVDFNVGYDFGDVADILPFWDPGSPYGEYSMNGQIFYIRDSSYSYTGENIPEFELNGENQTNPLNGYFGDLKGFLNSSSYSAGDGTIIIDGDLHIYSGRFDNSGNYAVTSTPKIIYDNDSISITKIESLASIAWIIKGDLIIEYDVEELAGNFIVLGADDVENCVKDPADYRFTPHCGAIYTAGLSVEEHFGDEWIPVTERKQLTINGFVIAKQFTLNRHYIDFENNLPAEIFINDGRALLNPPPGLDGLITSLPNWQTKIAP